jgi:DNA-binding transcriptional LysR family regulator
MYPRQLEYLVALARERHYGRAAEACHVSPAALSSGLSKLESELGVLIVRRGHRYLGLTSEGERVLAWARRLVADYDALRQDLARARGGLAGTLRVAAVPAALPSIALITAPFCARHPQAMVSVESASSIDIQRKLDALEIDVGVTYLENEPLRHVRSVRLYRERYVFVCASDHPFARRTSVEWREVTVGPLCLLAPVMQNRRIIDAVLRRVGAASSPRIETDSFVVLCSHVRQGTWASILPHGYFYVFGDTPGMSAVPIVKPVHTQWIGLAVADRDPPLPMAQALIDAVQDLEIERALLDAMPAARAGRRSFRRA